MINFRRMGQKKYSHEKIASLCFSIEALVFFLSSKIPNKPVILCGRAGILLCYWTKTHFQNPTLSEFSPLFSVYAWFRIIAENFPFGKVFFSH